MNQSREKREQLLDFLDKKIFDPVLEALPEQYSSQKEKQLLNDVQEVARYDKDFFHYELATAEEIKVEFLKETTRGENVRIARALEDLELPRMHLFRMQFLDLCKELKV